MPNVVFERSCDGFTLTELMTTLVVLGIVAAIATPSMNSFVQSNRLISATNDLVGDLAYARSEAVNRKATAAGTPINAGLCPSTDGNTCTAGGNWASGWIVFLDNDNSATWSAGDTLLKVRQALPPNHTVTPNPASDLIIFSNLGVVRGGTGAGDYAICNSNIGKSRTVTLGTTGRATLSSGSC